jgi:RNA polymerase sigma factor (sigma-70 family)
VRRGVVEEIAQVGDMDPRPSHVVNGIELFDYEALVRSRAWARWRRFKAPSASFADYYQEGWIGLTRAAERFDHTRGVKFLTYAYQYVDGYILLAMYGMQWAPAYLLKGVHAEHPKVMLPAALAFHSEEAERRAFQAIPARPDWRTTLRELYVDMTKALPERERYVLAQSSIGERTLTELGVELGVSTARVGQIRDKAIERVHESQRRYARKRPTPHEETWKPASRAAVPA